MYFYIYTCNDNDNCDNDDNYNKSKFIIDIYFIYTCNDNVDNDELYRYKNYYVYKSKNGLLFKTFCITGFKSTIYKNYII